MKTVDPHVYELARTFVDDTVSETGRSLTVEQQAALIRRAAEAMQQAIEDECEDIRQALRPLSAWRGGVQ